MSAKDSQFIDQALAHPWMFWVYFWKWPRIVRQACAEYDLLAKERDVAKEAHEQAVRANKIVRDWIHVTHRLDMTADMRAIWTAGKRLSALLLFLALTLSANAQLPPILRNQWTTNANPLALKVISTNGVHAATNVWELDFTNTATVTVSAVSNANKVMVSFTGSASSGSSSLTNALLHAGPTNGSVGALVLTAGTGIDLSTSGTNRVIASTSQPASTNLTNWSNIATNVLGSLQTPWLSDINAARFSLTNFNSLLSASTSGVAGFTIGNISDAPILKIDPLDVHSNAAPFYAFNLSVHNPNFTGQSNQVLQVWTYNHDGGNRVKTNESALVDVFESAWDTGGDGTTRQHEKYLVYITPAGEQSRVDSALHRWNVAGGTNVFTQRDLAYKHINFTGFTNSTYWCQFEQGENNLRYGAVSLFGKLTTSSNAANRGGFTINHGGDITFYNQFQSKSTVLSYPTGAGSNFFTITDVITQQTNRFQDWREVEIRTIDFPNTKLAVRAGFAQTDNLQNWKAANDSILSQISSNGGFQTLAGINVGSLVDPGKSNLVVGLNLGLPSSAGSVGQIWTLTNVASGYGAWSNAPSGSGIGSVFTNNALAGGPGLTEVGFTNSATVTVASTTNAGRVTLSFNASASGGATNAIGSIYTNNVLAGGPGLTELGFTNSTTVVVAATTNAGRETVSFDARTNTAGVYVIHGTTANSFYVSQGADISGGSIRLGFTSPKLGLERTGAGHFIYYNTSTGDTWLDMVFGGSKLNFAISGVSKWQVANAGHLLATTDNTVDIGASGATRPRNTYVANVNVSASAATDATNRIAITATGYTNTLTVGSVAVNVDVYFDAATAALQDSAGNALHTFQAGTNITAHLKPNWRLVGTTMAGTAIAH